MELSWSTLVLEVINFIVLVWILKRFLYKPVLDIIARRRADVEKTLTDAGERQHEAEALQREFEGRLADWNAERQKARDSLALEMDEERARQLTALRAMLAEEHEKARAADERRIADLHDQAEQRALELGARFASRLLGESATPDLQAQLLELLLTELGTWPAERLSALTASAGARPEKILVTSAFALSASQRQRLHDALAAAIQSDWPIEFAEDPKLLAGLRITIGSGVLGLNLQDELQGFTHLSDGG